MCGVVHVIKGLWNMKKEERKNREKQRQKPTKATAKYKKPNCCLCLWLVV